MNNTFLLLKEETPLDSEMMSQDHTGMPGVTVVQNYINFLFKNQTGITW